MYTMAYNSPNSPTGIVDIHDTVNPQGLISPYTDVPDLVTNDANRVKLQDNQQDLLTRLSNFGLSIFNSALNFVRRNNLFGSRSTQQFLARFGINADSDIASKLYEGQDRIKFYPVMSNSDTYNPSTQDGQGLGDYAGMGVSALDINFNYQTKDFGFILVVNWLQIVPIWLRGCKPHVFRIHSQDFWTPEYDGKTIRATK